MSGKAAKIVLTEMQKAELENISRSKISQQRWIQRARIILLAAAGMLNSEISSRVGIGRQQVGLWRRRWQQSQQALLTVELNEPRAELRRTIEVALTPSLRILVATQPADFRKGIDGLAAVCRQHLACDPMSGGVFVFCNRQASLVVGSHPIRSHFRHFEFTSMQHLYEVVLYDLAPKIVISTNGLYGSRVTSRDITTRDVTT